MMDRTDAELLLANRSFLFSLLVRGFAEEPDASFSDVLTQAATADQMTLVESSESEAIRSAFEQARRLAAKPDAQETLRREYVRVFVGPGTLKAHPWETVQRSGRNVLFQKEVLDVREAYREAGFLPVRYQHVPDDFIGIEFDFVNKLAQRAVDALHSGDEQRLQATLAQSDVFEQQHICTWVEAFAGEVDANYEPGFYGPFSHLAALVAKRDLTVLAALRS
jgi:TorA maturation chaperone TorD